MTDLPDRLSVNPNSPHYDEAVLARDVGIMFDGKEKTNVEEYCVSEGWIRVAAGNAKDRFGQPMTIKLKGLVAPFLRGSEAAEPASEQGGIGRAGSVCRCIRTAIMRAPTVTVPQRSSALLIVERDRAGCSDP